MQFWSTDNTKFKLVQVQVQVQIIPGFLFREDSPLSRSPNKNPQTICFNNHLRIKKIKVLKTTKPNQFKI